jgi:hypothetical protein
MANTYAKAPIVEAVLELMKFVLGETDTASDLGWQLPPAAPIHVALAGRADAEWALDEGETAF